MWKAVFGVLSWLGLGEAQGLLPPGSPFPAFQLVDQKGQVFSSSQLAGKPFLLWFYPKAMTPGCTKEGCALRDNYAAFQELGVAVVGVSFDSPETNARFAEEQHFPFPLLSDKDRALAVKVGAADSPSALFARRISYLVGADGRVLKVYEKVSPAEHAKEVLADLRALGLGPKS
jgi:peroxiredoxin Q/BCP